MNNNKNKIIFEENLDNPKLSHYKHVKSSKRNVYIIEKILIFI
jgi:hypothetical protein